MGELFNGPSRLKVPDQSIAILTALVEHPGLVITRDDLRRRLWPDDHYVDFEHGINAAVRRLRDALNDSAEAPKFIETLPKRGYRFIGPVVGAGLSVGDTLIEVDDAATVADSRVEKSDATNARWLKRERLAWILTVVFLILAGAALVWNSRHMESIAVDVVQFTIVPPGSAANQLQDQFAISPDGRHVAFIAAADGKQMLWVHSLETTEQHLLAGTEGAIKLFWKPDSQALGFFAGGVLKTVRLTGEQPIPVCAGLGEGAWNTEDVIVFGGQGGYLEGTALKQVNARGGTPAALTVLKGDEFAHGFPSFLPDGTHFLYLAQSPASSELQVGSLTSPDYFPLGLYESNAQYGRVISLRCDAATLSRSALMQPHSGWTGLRHTSPRRWERF